MMCPMLMLCPTITNTDCTKENCAWYCNEDGCAIKKIALELTRIEEK